MCKQLIMEQYLCFLMVLWNKHSTSTFLPKPNQLVSSPMLNQVIFWSKQYQVYFLSKPNQVVFQPKPSQTVTIHQSDLPVTGPLQ